MELELISSCCSTSSSPTCDVDAAENMTELEAAEALADLAQLAVKREQVFESAASWGSKGKRVRKRVKTESPPADSETLPTPDLAEERAVKEEEEVEPISREVTEAPVKAETNVETSKPNLASTLRCNRSSGCGRSRQNLSEAEREERRIRRILANRESARQTIRRRQAMCEELSKKAADLTYENENLRREKDWALKEFQSLETINKHLKEQVSKSLNESKELEESPRPSQVEISTSSTPFYFYNQNPYQLYCWPHVTQPSNSIVSPLESQNDFTTPFTTSGGDSAKTMTPQENGKPADGNGQKTHFYVVPCPWFLPAPDQSNGPPFTFEDPQTVVSSNGHHMDDSSAKPVEVTETLRSHLPTSIKEEESGSTETRPLYDLNESATEVLSEGDGFPVRQQAFSFKHEDVSVSPNGVTSMPPGHHVLVSLPGKKQGSLAAAEARKRRKELTKLKNLHGRQCRMQV